MLTWAGRLDLRLVLFGVRVEKVWGRVLAPLDLALKGVQTLNVLFFERTSRAARRAHVQVGGQLPPFLVLVHLVGDKGWRRLRKMPHTITERSVFHVLQRNCSKEQVYLCEAANLFDRHVEPEKI